MPHVLVVNETPEILTLFETLLTEEGYAVTLDTFGPQDLAEVKRVMPDLLILDFPVGQEGPGWQLLQKLKMERATAHLPIVICSGAVRQVRELDGWLGEKGISVLLKPFDIDDLLTTTRKMLRANAKAQAADRATPPTGA
jgi:DNA-binding response OmpR family regulator